MLHDLITNWALAIPASCWLLAHSIKTVVALLQGKGFDFSNMVGSGGMPSAHSAVVTSLAVTIGITQGLASPAFAITVVLAFIVMYDAANMRQSVGQQSTLINRIVRELRLRQPRIALEADLRELVGHTPFQVLVGAILGIAVALAWLTLMGV
jgi:acid phosphatase family membrane protein YuiD